MSEKRHRPSDGPLDNPPSRNLGMPSRDLGPSDASLIVAAGARKEKLKRRDAKLDLRRASPRPYAELRVASAFSFLDGSSLPEDLVEQAAKLGLPAMALVDANGVYGAPRFYKAARSAGLKALVGSEVTLANDEQARNPRALNSQFSISPASLSLSKTEPVTRTSAA